ncbi:MAG: SURF1 family protein [Chloroflexota bacterium]
MEIVKTLFSRKWILTTILAILAIGVMVRLGIWQLDRLEQRKIFNASVSNQQSQPTLMLTSASSLAGLVEMEYRAVEVIGRYDFSNEVALKNQANNGQLGVRLLTPLKITGSENYILVNRGWVANEYHSPDTWSEFSIDSEVVVKGIIRMPATKPTFGGIPDPTLTPAEDRLTHWSIVNLERIASESGLQMLPVYIQETPQNESETQPIAETPELDLTEGPHLGYAFQWFAFALTLAIGYPFYLRAQIIQTED